MMQTILFAAGAPGQNSLFLPALPELIWGTLAFAVIATTIWKVLLPKYNAVADERREKIEAGLTLAAQMKSRESESAAAAEAVIAAARQQSSELLADAHREADNIVARAKEQAKEEAGRISAAAQMQIRAEKQAAQISLRADVGLLAAELANKLVGEYLQDQALSARVIDRFLDELETQTADVKA